MSEIRKQAVKTRQGKRVLFLTFFTVDDFLKENFYRVDRLDVQKDEGMQRLLNTARAKSFCNDIVGADKQNEAFLPTSVFLATEGSISYDESTKELFFRPEEVCPFDVVDGQHRIEGLKMAAEKDSRLLSFPVSTIIAHEMSEAERMLQFVIVNTKQQPVNQGVAQHIISRFTKMLEVESLPYLPQWLKRKADSGDDDRALRIAKFLYNDEGSPWHGRIRFADNDRKDSRITINQASFVKSVKHHLLAKNHPLPQIGDETKQMQVLKNFWIAVNRIFIVHSGSKESGSKSVVFKYAGLEFFHSISGPLINKLAQNRNYTVDEIEKCILSVQDFLGPDAVEIMSPEFWHSGGKASGMNRTSVAKLAKQFADALSQSSSDEVRI